MPGIITSVSNVLAVTRPHVKHVQQGLFTPMAQVGKLRPTEGDGHLAGQDRNPEKGGKQPGSSQERGEGSVTDMAGLHRVNTRLPARDGTLGRS